MFILSVSLFCRSPSINIIHWFIKSLDSSLTRSYATRVYVCLPTYQPTCAAQYFDCFFSIIRLNIKIVHRPLSRYHQFEFIMYNELMIQIFSKHTMCTRRPIQIYLLLQQWHSHTQIALLKAVTSKL